MVKSHSARAPPSGASVGLHKRGRASVARDPQRTARWIGAPTQCDFCQVPRLRGLPSALGSSSCQTGWATSARHPHGTGSRRSRRRFKPPVLDSALEGGCGATGCSSWPCKVERGSGRGCLPRRRAGEGALQSETGFQVHLRREGQVAPSLPWLAFSPVVHLRGGFEAHLPRP